MNSAPVAASRHTSTTVWLALILLAALGWAVLIQQSGALGSTTQAMPDMNEMGRGSSGMSGMDGVDGMGGMSDTSSNPAPAVQPAAPPNSLLVYLPIWVAMMVAMMFPAAAPVVSLFTTLGRNRLA